MRLIEHRINRLPQRIVRDINVVASRFGFDPDTAHELHGRALLGLPPNSPLTRGRGGAAAPAPPRTFHRKRHGTTMLDLGNRTSRDAAAELRAAVPSGVAPPSDERYAEASRLWNGAVRHRPAMVAFCERTEDVEAAVRAARRHGLPLSVRGGGHDWAGRALRDGGLAIDLTRMRSVAVDREARVATVAGGARTKDVAAAAAAHGLLAVTGNCGAVGLAGLTLGGGYGLLSAAHGLAADNLLGADVVLADGRRVTAHAEAEPDLFWALRGGGGNFGVVTSMRVRLHEARDMRGGAIMYPLDEAGAALRRYAAFAAAAPDELGALAVLASGPDGLPAMLLASLWNGDGTRGERALRDLQQIGAPNFAQVGPTTYPDTLARFDAHTADDGRHWEMRTRWLPKLAPAPPPQSPRRSFARPRPTRRSPCTTSAAPPRAYPPGGTAFGLRREHFMVEIIAAWEPAGATVRTTGGGRGTCGATSRPLPCRAATPTLLGPDDRGQAADAYGGNAARLRALKRRYDPDNVFASAIPLPGG
jgi:FAD/FMN-containing dehydrogenase